MIAALWLAACPAGPDGGPDSGSAPDDDCAGTATDPGSLGAYPCVEAPGAPRYLQLGHDLAVADVTGDGAADLFAGSQEASVDNTESGEAWLFDGPSLEPVAHWEGKDFVSLLLGQAVDIADGAPPRLLVYSIEGIWVVEASAPTGYPGDVGGVLLGNDQDGYIVSSRVRAIDVLGDSLEDVAAQCFVDADLTTEAAVCVAQSPVTEDALIGDSDVVIDGEQVGSAFAGPDLDADGRPDLAIGADDLNGEAGAVHVVYGPLTPGHYDLSVVDHTWAGENPGDWLGQKLYQGDLDGDGVEELLADAMGWPDHERRGRVYALDPTVADIADAPLVIDGDPGLQHLGMGAAVADLDGDGVADLAVGAPGLNSMDATVRGRVFVFYGPVGGHLTSADAGRILSGVAPGDMTGASLGAGDLDGDGAADLVVAAPYADGDEITVGHIYILHGPILPD